MVNWELERRSWLSNLGSERTMNYLRQGFGKYFTSWILASLTLDYTQDFAKHLTNLLI